MALSVGTLFGYITPDARKAGPMVVHVDRLKKYQRHSYVNWLTEGKTGKDRVSTVGEASKSGQQLSSRTSSLRRQLRNLKRRPPLTRKHRKDHVGHQGDWPGQLTISWTKTLFTLYLASDILGTLI